MSIFSNSFHIKDILQRIGLLEAAAGFTEELDISAKADKPTSFTTGNFATYNTVTEEIEDTAINESSFVAAEGFVATEENYTTEEKAQLAALVANGGGGGYETHDKTNTNKSAAFTKDVTAGSILLYVIVQRVSGTPLFTLGTTVGADDLIPEITLAEGDNPLVHPANEPFIESTTLYAGITGGTVNVIFISYEDIISV
jgi:hypothetical protein